MGKYLAIYHGSANEDEKQQVTNDQSQTFMQAWAKWARENEAALVDPGSPLYTKKVITHEGIRDVKDTKTGYTIVKAETHDDAIKIFNSHPHLTFHTGNSIEVIECPSVPERQG